MFFSTPYTLFIFTISPKPSFFIKMSGTSLHCSFGDLDLNIPRINTTTSTRHAMVSTDQIHGFVKNLNDFARSGDEEPMYDLRLKKMALDVLRLVCLQDKHTVKINITTSQFPPLTVICYCSGSGVEYLQDIHQLVREKPHSESPSYFNDLLLALSTTTAPDGRPRHVKENFKTTVGLLNRYVRLVRQIYIDSKAQFAEYLGQCLIHEYTLAKNLNKRADETTDETEQLASALDELINKTEASDGDSIFEYRAPSSNHSELLDFSCDNEALNKAYEAVLHLGLLKPESQFYSSLPSLVRVMLQTIEKYHQVECMEIESFENREDQLQLFYQLFLGSEDGPGLIPARQARRAEAVLDTMKIPGENVSLDEGLELHLEAPLIAETLVAEGFLDQELQEVVSNLNTVVNVLNEYDPQFHPHFPFLFKTFIFLVYEEYNELASVEDYQYIEEVTEVVGQIREYEAAEDDMNGEIIRSITDHFHFLQGFLTYGYQKSTVLMRLANKLWTSSCELRKRKFRKWNDKTMSVIHLDSVLQLYLPYYNSKILRAKFEPWFDRYKKFLMLSSQASSYSGKKLVARVLKDLWIPKLIQIGDLGYQSQRIVLERQFVAWHARKTKILEMQKRLQSFYDRNLMAACFTQLKKRHDALKQDLKKAFSLDLIVKKKTDTIILKHMLQKWHTMLDASSSLATTELSSPKDWVLSEKLSRLDGIESRYLMSKHFKLWQKRMALQALYTKCSEINSKHTKLFFFRAWRNAFVLKGLQVQFGKRQDRNLVQSIFAHWREQKEQNKLAYSHHRKLVLNKIFKQWRLIHGMKNASLDLLSRVAYFKIWKLKAISRDLRDSVKRRSLHTFFNVWRAKEIRRQENETRGVTVARTNYHKAMFALWKSRMDINEELERFAQLNFQRTFLERWKKKYSNFKSLENAAASFQGEKALFNDRHLLKTYVRIWKDVVVLRFEAYSDGVISNFNRTVRLKGTLSVFMKHWRNRVAIADTKQRKLEFLFLQHNKASPALAPVFDLWIEKSRRNHEHEEVSRAFYEAVLHKKILVVWYEKLMVKVHYLDELADDLVNQKSYATSLDYLQKWNLKYIKTYKRNLQTCDMFKEKWDTSKARSLLQVWRHKTFHKESLEEVHDEDYAEANTSIFFSSLSPLAKKRGSFQEGHSYLHTPVKKQVTSTPFTPTSRIRRTSPTRLDTNHKMTSDKIDALINHYKKAKDQRGGKRHTLRLQDISTVRLSPPRPRTNYSTLPSKPPAPQFERILESSPKATSSPFEPGNYQKLPSPLPLADIDASVLSTAKKLKRFRPLVIPKGESPEDSSASPVLKLKERLENASRSFNSHSVS